MLRLKKVTEEYDLRVFTDSGEYFGDIDDAIITGNKVYGWKIKASKNSYLSKVVGSAKGVIVPHNLVKSMGDIVIISKAAMPSGSVSDEE